MNGRLGKRGLLRGVLDALVHCLSISVCPIYVWFFLSGVAAGNMWSQFILKTICYYVVEYRVGGDGDEIKRSCFRVALRWAALAQVERVFVYISHGMILRVWSGLVWSGRVASCWSAVGVGTRYRLHGQ
jgi:hypothetical protein